MAKPASLPELAQVYEQAVGHFRQGRFDDAEKSCNRILKSLPGSFDALHLIGLIRLRNGKPGAALGLIEQALKAQPQSAEALSNLALALAALNRNTEALAAFERALAVAPASFETHNNRGNVLMNFGRAGDALADFDRALALQPQNDGARMNRGNALAQLGRLPEAVAEYDRVLMAQPGNAQTNFNRGNALSALGRYADAVAAFDRALAVNPQYLGALTNRGMALQALGRHREALASFRSVLALDKTNADAHHNEALILLTLGDYRAGLPKYEYRWQRTGMPAKRRSFGKPLWLGEYPLARKTILIHAEQGLGDTIQFVRYAPMLARAGATVVLEVQPELAGLLGRAEGVATVVRRGEPLPAFDVHCPVGSLPLALKTELASIPATGPYLKASDERVAKWRERIGSVASPRVAVVWSGSAAHANDRNRSVPFERFASLFADQSVRFISIQRELRGEDAVASVPQLLHIGGELDDFDDTAAVVSLCDVVITVDTSVAHLAGALGRPVWILLPFWPDWRWMLDRDDSPWYPTAKLFRQSAPGGWDGVIARVRAELAQFAKA